MCLMHAVKTCSIPECAGVHKARGYCQKHYRRWQRHGDANRETRTPAPPGERVRRRSKWNGSCLEFQGCMNEWGYGHLRVAGKTKLAHRVVMEEIHGDISGFFVCHHCDNPKCVNPEHLYLGDASTNAQDREDRGRGHDIRGKNNPQYHRRM